MGGRPLSDPSPYRAPRCSLLGLASHQVDTQRPRICCGHSLESQTPEEPFLLTSHLDKRGIGQAECHRTLLWPRFSLLSPATSTFVWMVRDCLAGRLDLRGFRHRWAGSSASWPP